jgi:hypothetical protein
MACSVTLFITTIEMRRLIGLLSFVESSGVVDANHTTRPILFPGTPTALNARRAALARFWSDDQLPKPSDSLAATR